MESLAQILKSQRKALKIRSVDLAKSLKIDQALISKYENGKRLPTKAQIKPLSRILEVPYQELLVLYYKEFMLKYLSYDETSLKAVVLVQEELRQIVKPSVKAKEKAISFSTHRLDKLHARYLKLDQTKKAKIKNDHWITALAYNLQLGGNSLLAIEVKQIIEQGLTIPGKSLQEHFEVMNNYNLIRAFSQMKPPQSLDDLVSFHQQMFNGNSKVMAGRLKQDIDREKCQVFLRDLNKDWHDKHPVILASEVRSFFLNNHVFEEGNLQFAHILSNFILDKHDFLPALIQAEDMESNEYQKAWKNWQELTVNSGMTKWLATLLLNAYQKLFQI